MNIFKPQKPYIFHPAKYSVVLAPLLKKLSEIFYYRRKFHMRHMIVEGADRLAELARGRHAILVAPNHADHADPHVMLNAARQHGLAFHFMAARENSVAMQYAFDTCMSKERDKLSWGEIGPSLVKEVVEIFNLQNFVKQYNTFCPIPGCMWHMLIDPRFQDDFAKREDIYAVHLWNEMWRRHGADKTNNFHKDSIYEKLKKKYL